MSAYEKLMSLAVISIVLFFTLQILLFRILRNKKKKRMWALLPLALMLIWGGVVGVSWMIDPTSHNLWPFEFLILCVGGLIYSVAFLLFQKLTS
jgi:hypothetical protein